MSEEVLEKAKTLSGKLKENGVPHEEVDALAAYLRWLTQNGATKGSELQAVLALLDARINTGLFARGKQTQNQVGALKKALGDPNSTPPPELADFLGWTDWHLRYLETSPPQVDADVSAEAAAAPASEPASAAASQRQPVRPQRPIAAVAGHAATARFTGRVTWVNENGSLGRISCPGDQEEIGVHSVAVRGLVLIVGPEVSFVMNQDDAGGRWAVQVRVVATPEHPGGDR